MKCLFILSLAVSAFARPQAQYGIPLPPNSQSVSSVNQFSQTFVSGPSENSADSAESGPRVYKHISIHVAPKEEDEIPMKRVIRPMEKPEKIVNIIFIRAPSPRSQQQTEIILPEQNEQKTIVYVLLRKSDANTDIKIRQPKPAPLAKPEVFFIKYGKSQAQTAQVAQSGQSQKEAEGYA